MVIFDDELLVHAINERNEKDALRLIEDGHSLEPVNGHDPLHLSIYNDMTLVTLKLLEHGVPPGRRGRDDEWALVLALEKKDFVIADALIRYGFNLESRNAKSNGVTPLMEAYPMIDIEALEYLLGKGVKINARDYNGNSMLMWAVSPEEPDKVAALLAHGANPLLRNNAGENAIQLHQKFGTPSPDSKKISAMLEAAAKKITDDGMRLPKDTQALRTMRVNKKPK